MIELKIFRWPGKDTVCPICRSGRVRELCEVNSYKIWRCCLCATDFVWPMPDNKMLQELYDRESWFEGGERGGYRSYDAQTEHSIRSFTKILDEFEEHITSSCSILDVGCGYGTHLEIAAKRGWNAFGVEISKHARKIAKERHGSNLYIVDRIEKLIPHEFDVILLFDVIEYLRDPYQLFYDLFSKGAITEKTTIIITTPNARSYEAIVQPEKWAFRHPPSHLIYYSGESLKTLLVNLHFAEIKITGEYFLGPDKKASYGDERSSLNNDLMVYSGLICKASGSDFKEFMHERYVPGTWSNIAAYEHLPKYLFARSLVAGKKVLDFGCGSGYGSALLAEVAERVVGLDISESALQWANQYYANPRIRFERRTDIGRGMAGQSFDVIICLETIEHLDQKTQIEAINNFHRLLIPGGKLVISTPSPEAALRYGENPYHLHEMKEQEFEKLLRSEFQYVTILKQWISLGAMISAQPIPQSSPYILETPILSKDQYSSTLPVSYIAICSDELITDVQDLYYFDPSVDYVGETLEIDRTVEEIRSENYELRNTNELVKELSSQLHEVYEKIQTKDKQLSAADKMLHEAYEQIETKDQLLHEAYEQIETKDQLLHEIFTSKSWHLITRMRRIKQSLCFWQFFDKKKNYLIDEKTYRVKIIHPIRKHRPKIIHALANFMTGGSSRLVVDLIEHLGHKYDQEVMTHFIPDPPAYHGCYTHDFSEPVTVEEIVTFLREKKIKIIHVHYWGESDTAWYWKVFEAANDCSCVLIENVNTPVKPYISENVDHYVYVSDYAMNLFTPVAEKSTVIYPGSNLTMFQREGAPIPDDVIGMVYRLEEDKLREDSIQVFIEVVKRRPRTRVIIVGGGTFLDSYKRQVALQRLENNFEFTGYVAYERLPEYYRRLSVFVAPVWKESFGQVSSFAMSMKIPVAGYRVGALEEILGSSECLGKDTASLSDIIIDLLEDRKRRIKIGEDNYNKAVESFSIKKMIIKYDYLYKRYLNDK